jgi:hypothetical protein
METIVQNTRVPSEITRLYPGLGKKTHGANSNFQLKTLFLPITFLFFLQTVSSATYYLTANGNPTTLTLWWDNPAGTGNHPSNFTTSNDVFIIPSAVVGTLSNGGTWTIGSGVTLDLQKNTTGYQINYGGGGSTFVLSSGATLITANPNGISNATNDGALNSNAKLTKTLNIAANYTFNGTAQSTAGMPATVNNLTFSGTGAKNLATATTINGIFSLENGSNVNTYTGTPTIGSTGTLQYNAGASTRTVGIEWPSSPTTFPGSGGVIIKGTAAVSITSGNRDLNGKPLNVNAGSILDMGLQTLIASSLTNNGTIRFSGDANGLAVNSGTIDYYGGSSQVVANGTYSTLKISNTGGATINASTTASTLNVVNGCILNVSATNSLTVLSTLSNAGTLNLLSNTVGPATILTPDSIGGGGVFTISQYMTGDGGSTPNKRFWYTSNPMSGSTTNGFGISATSKLWKYDETGHTYNQLSSNENNGKGRGYVSRFGANTTVTHGGGTAKYYSGDISIPVSRTGTSDGKRGYHIRQF